MSHNSIKLIEVTNQIKSKGYDYMYIDDNTINGTLHPSVFQDVKKLYYIKKSGEKRYVSAGINPALLNFFLSKDGLDITALKEDDFPDKQIYSHSNVFSYNKDMINIYLIEGETVIGYITGSSNTSEIPTSNFDIVISYVHIDPHHRGNKLCKLMIQLFLLNVNLSFETNLSFGLYNIGEEISCKCYFDAFTQCGYQTFYYNVDDDLQNTEGKILSRNLCSSNVIIMVFLYVDTASGKYKIKKIKKINKTKNRKRKNNKRKNSSNKRRSNLK
jgi:hypothetical protein